MPGRCKKCHYALVLVHIRDDEWQWVEADTRLPHRRCWSELVDVGGEG